ncbi:MAG: hypothetical protein K2V38_19775, partial [Gemmataceae bacterium]|nr:hypothetical protein [Gemmataceae bacterium]
MEWLWRGLVGLAVGWLCAGCAEPPPPEFISHADKFRVQFGGVPAKSEKTISGARSARYAVETPTGARIVAVTELPLKGEATPDVVSQVLRSAQSDLIRAGEGKLESDSPITLA